MESFDDLQATIEEQIDALIKSGSGLNLCTSLVIMWQRCTACYNHQSTSANQLLKGTYQLTQKIEGVDNCLYLFLEDTSYCKFCHKPLFKVLQKELIKK